MLSALASSVWLECKTGNGLQVHRFSPGLIKKILIKVIEEKLSLYSKELELRQDVLRYEYIGIAILIELSPNQDKKSNLAV